MCSRSRSTTSWRPAATARCSSSLAPGLGARRDRPLRGRLLVRRYGSDGARRDRRPAGWRRSPRARVRARASARLRRERRVDSPYESLGRPIRGPRALTGDWRPVLAPDLQHRGDAVEAAVLRLGAGLPLAARPARCCCSSCCTCSSRRSRTSAWARAPSRTSTASQLLGVDRAVHVLRRGDDGIGAQRPRQRDSGSQDPVSADGDPAVGGAARVVQPVA